MARSVMGNLFPIWGFGVALVLFAGHMAVTKMTADDQGKASLGWPVVPGTVTASTVGDKLITATRGGNHHEWRADVTYSYQVHGAPFTGRRLSFEEPFSTDRTRAEAQVARYPVGTAVSVHYDPSAPDSCVIEAGAPAAKWHRKAIGTGGVGLALIALAFIIASAMTRPKP